MRTPPDDLIALLAQAYDDASRPPGAGRPPHIGCSQEWQSACRKWMQAALTAAERAGWRIER